MKTMTANQTEVESVTHEGMNVDAKGRAHGLILKTFEVDFVEVQVDAKSFYSIKPGHYFAASMQSSKDGKAFGASQKTQYFKTREERTAEIIKRLGSMLKK